MIVWLTLEPEYVFIKANAPLPGGGGGLFRQRVLPGQSFGPYSYETLRRMGNGQHELAFPGTAEGEGSVENKQDAGP